MEKRKWQIYTKLEIMEKDMEKIEEDRFENLLGERACRKRV